jgi:glycosyltransferase involved in cell wall biosynthesis
VFALTSDTETFGVVLAEALALGVPVISTRCGGPNDIVNATNGLLVPPGDVEAMAQALQDMRRNLANYLPEKLRADCHDRFSTQSVSTRIAEIYSKAIASYSRSSAD